MSLSGSEGAGIRAGVPIEDPDLDWVSDPLTTSPPDGNCFTSQHEPVYPIRHNSFHQIGSGSSRKDSVSVIDPRRFTPTLHASLVSEILSLRRDIDARDSLIGELEHTLMEAKSENEELEERLSLQNREFREVRRQLEQIEQSTVAALEELVHERDELKDGQTELRSKLSMSEQRVQASEAEVRRSHETLHQARTEWDNQRRRLEQRVHISEGRLKSMIKELATTSAGVGSTYKHLNGPAGLPEDAFTEVENEFESHHVQSYNGDATSLRSPTPSPPKKPTRAHSRNISALSQRSGGRPFSRFSTISISSINRANGPTLADELNFDDQLEGDYDLSLLIEEDEENVSEHDLRKLRVRLSKDVSPKLGIRWHGEKAKRILGLARESSPTRQSSSSAACATNIPPPLSDFTLSPRSVTRAVLPGSPDLLHSPDAGSVAGLFQSDQVSPTRSATGSLLASFSNAVAAGESNLIVEQNFSDDHISPSPTSDRSMDPRISSIEELSEEDESAGIVRSRPTSKVLREVIRLEARSRVSVTSAQPVSHRRSSSATLPIDGFHRRSTSIPTTSVGPHGSHHPLNRQDDGNGKGVGCKVCGQPLTSRFSSTDEKHTEEWASEDGDPSMGPESKTLIATTQKMELSQTTVVASVEPVVAGVLVHLVKSIERAASMDDACVELQTELGSDPDCKRMQSSDRVSAGVQTHPPQLRSFITLPNKVCNSTQTELHPPAVPAAQSFLPCWANVGVQTDPTSASENPFESSDVALSDVIRNVPQPIAIPSITIIPPASTPQSPFEELHSLPRESIGTQTGPAQVRSFGMQTEPIRIDQRILARLPPHLQKAALALRSSTARGSQTLNSPLAQPAVPNCPTGTSTDPRAESPDCQPARSNEDGPFTSKTQNHLNSRRPLRTSGLFADMDDGSENGVGDQFATTSLQNFARSRGRGWQAAGKVPIAVPEDREIGLSARGHLEDLTPKATQYSKSRGPSTGLIRQPSIRRSAMIHSGTAAHMNQYQSGSHRRSPSFGSATAGSGVPPPFPVPNRISSRRPFSNGRAKSEESCLSSPYGSISGSSPSQGTSSRHPSSRDPLRKSRSAINVIDNKRGSCSSVSAGTADRRSSDMSANRRRRSAMSSSGQERSSHGRDTQPHPKPSTLYSSICNDLSGQNCVVDAIAATMVGEWLWKYVRRKKSFTITADPADATRDDTTGALTGSPGQRHRRWVWISPYERSIMWSHKQPTNGTALLGKGGRKLTVQSVLDVKDDSPLPKGGNGTPVGRSILVLTPTRALKFTAMSLERHHIWLSALSFLSHTASTLPNLTSVAPLVVSSQQLVPAAPDELVGVPYRSTLPPAPATPSADVSDIHEAAEPPSVPRVHPSAASASASNRHSRKRSLTGPQHPNFPLPSLDFQRTRFEASDGPSVDPSLASSYATSTWHAPTRRPPPLSLRSASSHISGTLSVRSGTSSRQANPISSFGWTSLDAAEPPPPIALLQHPRDARGRSANSPVLNVASPSLVGIDTSGTVRMRAFISDQSGDEEEHGNQTERSFRHSITSSDVAEIFEASEGDSISEINVNDGDAVVNNRSNRDNRESIRGNTEPADPSPVESTCGGSSAVVILTAPQPSQSRRRSFFNLLAGKLSPSVPPPSPVPSANQALAVPPPAQSPLSPSSPSSPPPPPPPSFSQSPRPTATATATGKLSLSAEGSSPKSAPGGGSSSIDPPAMSVPATPNSPKIAIAVDITAPDSSATSPIFYRGGSTPVSLHTVPLHSSSIPRSSAFPQSGVSFPASASRFHSNSGLDLSSAAPSLHGPSVGGAVPNSVMASHLSTRSSLSIGSATSSNGGSDLFKGF